MINFKENDNIIWDSGFGYEIGTFKGKSNCDDNYVIDLKSGNILDKISVPFNEVFLYSDELIFKLSNKYGYIKEYSINF